MSRRLLTDPIVLLLAATVAVSAFFLAWPGVDIWVSALFYEPGVGFTLSSDPLLIALRHSNDVAMVTIIAAVLASLAAKLARPERPSVIPPSASLFLVASLALAPGVLVNLVLKNQWGRPRPVMVEAFGGSAPYVEVWRITDYCSTNCSFVAGEASSAIWLTGLALVVPRKWRPATALATGAAALALSLNRIAFGGHFLSDVLLSWCLTLLLMAVVYRLTIARPPSWLANDRLERGLERLRPARRIDGRKR
ncbi:MAG: phosphatase PAP2 family protein [Bauldia sp.]